MLFEDLLYPAGVYVKTRCAFLTMAFAINCCSYSQAVPRATWTEPNPSSIAQPFHSILFTDHSHLVAAGADTLTVFEITPSTIRKTAETTLSDPQDIPLNHLAAFQRLHLAASGDVILDNRVIQLAAFKVIDHLPRNSILSRDGSMLGIQTAPSNIYAGGTSPGTWCIATLSEQDACLSEGSGLLLALDRSAAVIRDSDSIRVEGLHHILLGRIGLSEPRELTEAGFISDNKILISGKHSDLYSPQGIRIMRLAFIYPLGGIQPDRTGDRVLISRPGRQISPFKSLGEVSTALLTLGLGVSDQDFNRTTFTVMDTTTGRTCLETLIRYPEFSYPWPAAGLSPDGKLLAIAERNTLKLYQLPDSCSLKAHP